MATILFFHAHPDDEALATGGTMAAAADAGHRVVVVFATRGERGIVPADLQGHASLGALREAEARRAGGLLGAARVEFLGYQDSGEDGASPHPTSFVAAEAAQAASRLARLIDEEAADVVTIYDSWGVTGHPDHRRVHEVGLLAARNAATPPEIYEATLAASQIATIVDIVVAAATEAGPGSEPPTPPRGTPDEEVTTTLDVRPWLQRKRAAMTAHASQMPESSMFLAMPTEAFAAVWGHEHYVHRGPRASGADLLTRLIESAERTDTPC